MLKSLYPEIAWDAVRVVGFDMDGVLYDEFDFIAQVYDPVSGEIAAATGGDRVEIHRAMLLRWLEEGSSYNGIFSEQLLAGGLGEQEAAQIAEKCVAIFRGFLPVLTLSRRVRALLDWMAARYGMFLVTDGSCALQTEKFQALGLGRWFRPENTAVSGCVGRGHEKPGTGMLAGISILREGGNAPGSVVYFGDREVDRRFANAAGFGFVPVLHMHLARSPALPQGRLPLYGR